MLPNLGGLGVRLCDISMKRGAEEERRPTGVDEQEWARYERDKRIQPPGSKGAVRPRAAYKLWREDDFKECREENPLHFAPGEPGRIVPHTIPPSVEDLFSNPDTLWMLNVKPPWATALVYGLKDVENRTWGFKGDRWTLIVASSKQTSQYNRSATADLNTRLEKSGQSAWKCKFPTDVYQAIVGLVKFRAYTFDQFTYEERRCSVWYNGDYVQNDGTILANDNALHVEAAFRFERPIRYTHGMLSMYRFVSATERDPELAAQVKDAISRLQHPYGPLQVQPCTPTPPSNPTCSMDGADDKVSESGLALPLPPLPSIHNNAPKALPLVDLSSRVSLNEWGCMAREFDLSSGVQHPLQHPYAAFVESVNVGAQEWMASHLARALVEPPRKPEFAQGYRIWRNTDASIRQTILNYFDVRTREGAIRLFDSTLRRASIPPEVRDYLDDRLRYVKQGMRATAQGNSYKAWTHTGFGIWTRIWTALGLKLLARAKTILSEQGFTTHVAGVPHIIYKPPRGDNLFAHHDQMPTLELIQNLKEHVNSNDSTVEAWVRKYNMQLLAHIYGGHDDGYTYTVGPLNCATLLFCMELIVKNPPDIAAAAWSASATYKAFVMDDSGPYFVDWHKLVGPTGAGPLNKHLERNGFQTLRIIPIKPFSSHNQPYLAMWPVGFPHGSMKNQEPRITLTMNLSVKKDQLSKRAIRRLKNLAIIAHEGSTDAEVAMAEEAFKNDTEPYHEGGTHKMPEMMADLQRNAAYATNGRPVGPFAAIAPTRADVEEFLS